MEVTAVYLTRRREAPGDAVVKNLPMQELQETWVRSLGQEDPVEKGMPTHPSWSMENSMDRGAW